MSDIPPITTEFAEHASPDAIRADLAEARRMRNRWNRRVVRLAALLDQRTAEAETWPAPQAPEAPRSALNATETPATPDPSVIGPANTPEAHSAPRTAQPEGAS